MLIHKTTMGVLDQVWTGLHRKGPDGLLVPVYKEAWLADFPELDPAEWWETERNSSLGRRVRRYYPFLRPVEGEDGGLLAVELLHPDRTAQDIDEERTQEAKRRGYPNRRRLRPLGLLPFLDAPERATNGRI